MFPKTKFLLKKPQINKIISIKTLFFFKFAVFLCYFQLLASLLLILHIFYAFTYPLAIVFISFFLHLVIIFSFYFTTSSFSQAFVTFCSAIFLLLLASSQSLDTFSLSQTLISQVAFSCCSFKQSFCQFQLFVTFFLPSANHLLALLCALTFSYLLATFSFQLVF